MGIRLAAMWLVVGLACAAGIYWRLLILLPVLVGAVAVVGNATWDEVRERFVKPS